MRIENQSGPHSFKYIATLCCLSLLFPVVAQGEIDLMSDTWVATDALGREVPGHDEVGPPKKDKWVGIFYWTWHVPRGDGTGPNDNTKLLATAKDGKVDWPNNGVPHHWGEPELGYYMMTDPFVIRKHASMLTDAGVDVVLFDTTNPPHTWKNEYEALCKTYTEMRAEGNKTPSIGFICPFGDPTPVLNRVWADLYKLGLWSELWFQWKGKPFILANKDYVKDPEQVEFFTFRRPMPDYWVGPSGPEQWSWLEVFPQHIFKDKDGNPEQMSVGVAHNALPDTPGPAPMSHKKGAMGRSWHDGARDLREGAVGLGLNFQEQWDRALEVDPEFIFVTGWNEWIAGRFQKWSKYTADDSYYPEGMFVDQYDQEYSRDCEPMVGGHTDNYYYQLVSNIRKFKGARPIHTSGESNPLSHYLDTIGDVTHRDHPGYGPLLYTNTTGRNDIVLSMVYHDEKNFYIMAECANKITPPDDSLWMLLFIDADQDASTGWLGYDYLINRERIDETNCTIEQWKNGGWEKSGKVRFSVFAQGEKIQFFIPHKAIKEHKDSPNFDFHWADNIQKMESIADFGVDGDSAPNRRWNYRYKTTP